MNSKERFNYICQHQKPDRFPIDYLAMPETDKRLKAYYGVETEEQLLDVLGCDFYYLSCRDISQNESCYPFYTEPELNVIEKERTCPFGIRWKRGAYNSKFAVDDVIVGPLENAMSSDDILKHPWPQVEHFDFETFHKECEMHNDKVIVGGMWTGILGDSYRLLGFENFLFKIATSPELIKTLVDRMTDFYLEINDCLFSQLKGKMDIWFSGNDFGSQGGLLFSQAMFEKFFYDNIKKLVQHAHSYGLKVMMHSCGSIVKVIPLLIEAGVDILDPIQITAADMEPKLLQEQFGKKIIFHGGVDTQHVLPNKSVDQVYQHAREIIQTLGKDAGYIFAPSQILQPDIPVDNVDAMYRAAREYKIVRQ